MIKNEIWYISKYAVSPSFGGPSRQFFFCKYFAKKGRQVTLVSSRSTTLKTAPDFGLSFYSKYNTEGVNGVMIRGPKVALGFSLKRVFSWLFFEIGVLFWAILAKKEKPDVIIVSSLSILTFMTGSILKRYFKCVLVCEVRDIWPLTIVETKNLSYKNLFVRILSKIELTGYRNADVIIGTMPNLRGHVERISPENAMKVKHIPMGFDPEYWTHTPQIELSDPFEKFFQEVIPEGNFVVGYAGTMGLVNCVDLIVNAAERLVREPISFVLLGDGSLKEELKKKVKNFESNNVHFLDAVDKNLVQKFLSNCDLLLNPWKGGGTIYSYGVSPNKWIDYMYSAKPILVSLDGFPSIINEANCGRFIQADNVKLLADEILNFSKMDTVDLQNMGSRGREFLMKNLTYDILADQYLRILDSISRS